MYTGARIQGRLALPLCDLFPDFTFVPGAWRQPAHSTPLTLLSRYFLSSYLSTTCADHDDNAQLTAILSQRPLVLLTHNVWMPTNWDDGLDLQQRVASENASLCRIA